MTNKPSNNPEHDKLIEIIKFTPRTYKIQLWGYGGEKVMGTVSKEVWDYCNDHQVDLVDIAWSDEDTVENAMGLDLEMLPYQPGQWYECDDMAHVNGVSRDSGHIQIEDENGNTIFDKSLNDCDGGSEDSPTWSCQDEIWVGMKKKGEVVFIGSSNEKGTFFEGDIELKAPFNIELLELHYDEVDGEEIVNAVYYDGEEIENYGGSTDGKSSDMNMVILTDDNGNWERYSPEEKDWGHPPLGASPGDWERSPKFKFNTDKPVYPGYYSVNWGYGSTYGVLYWDGKAFGDWEYGKFNPVNQEGVVSWSGYNWDTSNWINQPPEPPNVICSNKKCKWVGDSSQRIEDDEYNNHCPNCNGTDFDWIDYDPNTAKGLKNREKYCKPWDPVAALNSIRIPEELTKENDMTWPFGPDETAPAPFPGSNETTEKKTLTAWTVSTYYKKSIEEVEHFVKDGMEIVHRTGWRSGSWTVYTNDGNPPAFEFDYVPGGNDAKDSIDMNSCYTNNIEEVEFNETWDGCWDETEYPDDMDEDEQAAIEEAMEEEGYYSALEDNDWYHTDTEMWIWGPILIEGENGFRKIIVADENGNVTDFVED